MRGRNKKRRHYADYFVAVNVTDAEDGVNKTLALHHLPRSGWYNRCEGRVKQT